MGIGNYTNLSEIMNSMLEAEHGVSISDMVREAGNRKLILASEGEQADQADLENAFIALADVQYRAGMISLDPENEMEDHLIQLYKSGRSGKEWVRWKRRRRVFAHQMDRSNRQPSGNYEYKPLTLNLHE